MENSRAPRPKWLRKLERESWQAELLISGAAIVGALQLPALLKEYQYYLLLNFTDTTLKLWFFATAYWALLVYILVFLFLFHFVVRAVWIGMVGLNSIYPNGFKRHELSSEHLQQKLEDEYGDVSGYISALDKFASGIFGKGFAASAIFLNLGFGISALILIATALIKWGVQEAYAIPIILAPVAVIAILSILSLVMNIESLRDKEWVKRWHYPLTQLLQRLTYPIARHFTVVGLTLYSTNATSQDASAWKIFKAFVITLLASILFGFVLGASGIFKPQFKQSYYHRMGEDPTRFDAANFADEPKDDLLYEPMLNSHYLTPDGPRWLFVPLMEREYSGMMDNCTLPPVDPELDKASSRITTHQRTIKCAAEYITIFLDGEELADLQPLREYRTSVGLGQFGVRYELSSVPLSHGPHQLKVVTNYALEVNDSIKLRTTYIPIHVVEHIPE